MIQTQLLLKITELDHLFQDTGMSKRALVLCLTPKMRSGMVGDMVTNPLEILLISDKGIMSVVLASVQKSDEVNRVVGLEGSGAWMSWRDRNPRGIAPFMLEKQGKVQGTSTEIAIGNVQSQRLKYGVIFGERESGQTLADILMVQMSNQEVISARPLDTQFIVLLICICN